MTFNKFGWTLGLFAIIAGPTISLACSAPQTKAATNTLVRIGDDACKEVTGDSTVDPELVMLTCAVDAAGNVVKVLLPRTQWHDILAKKSKVDAGPGK